MHPAHRSDPGHLLRAGYRVLCPARLCRRPRCAFGRALVRAPVSTAEPAVPDHPSSRTGHSTVARHGVPTGLSAARRLYLHALSGCGHNGGSGRARPGESSSPRPKRSGRERNARHERLAVLSVSGTAKAVPYADRRTGISQTLDITRLTSRPTRQPNTTSASRCSPCPTPTADDSPASADAMTIAAVIGA